MSTSPNPSPRGLLVSSRYRIQRRLGSGSMGTVFLAEDGVANRLVALKVIQTERLQPGGLARLQREFSTLATLRHPQIATAFDFGYAKDGNLPFYTREYLKGIPLAPGPPRTEKEADPKQFLKPFLDLLDALHYLHAHETLHLDIHAGNLIVTEDSTRGSVLIDFGLLRPGGRSTSPRGFPFCSHLAPELLRGDPPEPATDLYAVGRLLLYRLIGQYDGEAKLPSEIPGWGSRLTLELERIVSKALQHESDQRFSSALAFRRVLAETLGDRELQLRAGEPEELTVGRDEEIDRLERALNDVTNGKTSICWFVGPVGMGKTRLLTEARWRAQLRGLDVADVQFLPQSESAPLLPKILHSMVSSRRSSSWLSPLSKEHGGSSQERCHRAAESYFAETGPPLILLLDDLEYADRESTLLAEALLAECARRFEAKSTSRGLGIIVGCTQRPRRQLLDSRSRLFVHKLKPLPQPTAKALLGKLLRPLSVPDPFLARVAREAQGRPLRLGQLARALLLEHGPSGKIPARTTLPKEALHAPGIQDFLEEGDLVQLQILRVLAVFRRAADKKEIAAACGFSTKTTTRGLRKLSASEVITASRQQKVRLYYLADSTVIEKLILGLSKNEIRRMHAQVAAYLQGVSAPSLQQKESLSRHLLAAGRQRQGREMAFNTAELLNQRGLVVSAARLLEETALQEKSQRWQLRLAERISEMYGLAGDHLEGIAALEPLFQRQKRRLNSTQTVRILRRLGFHHHRAGRAEIAIPLFKQALGLARPDRDRQELVLIYSELAELRTFRGEYEEAEDACRRGLELLRTTTRGSPSFRGDMEVTLRATLGHLELRRLSLESARREFDKALQLTFSHGTTGLRALILNNLGIVHNQLNHFSSARRCFRQAERLLAAAGERSTLIHIACNLAIISAKQGKAVEAAENLEKASRLLLEHPGDRLEFFVAISRSVALHHLGDMNSAIEGFQKAIPLGQKFGDRFLVGFSEVYLAEAQMACGLYPEALRTLRSTFSHAEKAGPPVLSRMAAARLLFLERLLGQRRTTPRALRTLENAQRTSIELLEAWNDLFLAFCRWRQDEQRSAENAGFEGSFRSFRRLGVPAGYRLARIGLLYQSIQRGTSDAVRSILMQIERENSDDACHLFLSVLEPMASAEACFLLGDLDRCHHYLQKASGNMVGLPFLELDWRIEFLSARLSERQGDRHGARHHLHRCLQARHLLLRSFPRGWKGPFLEHPRFAQLEDFRSRLEYPPETPRTPLRAEATGYRGLIGTSPAMKRVFETLARLKDLDMPVLITGETGTGKEVAAKAIHESGPRRRGPFYSLHCASLPRDLFESELFGYEAGAFTGADESRTGLLAHLSGGTILLDDISHLSLETQTKLLQVFDKNVVRPLGSLKVRPVDVRFMASASVDIDHAVREGIVREDLLYRLRGFEVRLPPLRSRPEDLPPLARHFLELHGRRLERTPPTLSPQSLFCLGEYDWPGNVRELESLMIRLLVSVSPGSVVEPQDIRDLLSPAPEVDLFPDDLLAGRSLRDLRQELDKAYLLRLFRESRGNVQTMTKALGVKRSNLYTWFRKVGIDIRALRDKLQL